MTANARRPGRAVVAGLVLLAAVGGQPVRADATGPRLAAYYDRFLALCGDRVFEWQDEGPPRAVMDGIRQVGVGKHRAYALTHAGQLLTWSDGDDPPVTVMDGVASFHAGRSGLFAIRHDGELWYLQVHGLLGFGERPAETPLRVAGGVRTAAIGDSADYYVTESGELYVRGRAHRGQYGDGRLEPTETFVRTARDVVQVVAHTGHALILKRDGSVWGTGGNIHGPLGEHGYGDKAVRWGRITGDAVAIATGSSHSLALGRDGGLWTWGRHIGLEPERMLEQVDAAAGADGYSLALGQGRLWRWRTGGRPQAIMACE